jgi:hypothetical protein
MAAAAHDPAFAKKVGIPTTVAKDFNNADVKHPKVCCNGYRRDD